MEKGKNFKMNRRLSIALILLGMGMSRLPMIIQLGLFGGLFSYLYISWDEYLYQQTQKRRRQEQSV